jgi:hypothetical protein
LPKVVLKANVECAQPQHDALKLATNAKAVAIAVVAAGVMLAACAHSSNEEWTDAGPATDARQDDATSIRSMYPGAPAGDATETDAASAQDPMDRRAIAGDASPADAGSTRDADGQEWSGVIGCAPESKIATLINGNVQIGYDLTTGIASFSYAGIPKVSGFYAGAGLVHYTTSQQYSVHACALSPEGMTITSTGAGLPTMMQTFRADGGNHFLTQLILQGSGLSTNWMAPVVVDPSTGQVDVGSYADSRSLVVPFDNDDWVTYNAQSMNSTATSYEVGGFYDNLSRNGIVVGSVTHDTWKTGVYYVGQSDKLSALTVFGGISSALQGPDGGALTASGTHDVLPHGQVTGDTVASPVVFVGYGPDWRDLLDEYADSNAAQTPMLAWSGGVPFGWNSWGKIQQNIDYTKAIAASDFIGTILQPAGYSNSGTVYVNLDSYWDNLSAAQLGNFVAHCHANRQKTGIYWAPFADWGLSATRLVEGTTSTTYQQIWLRDASGNPIELDGAYAVDPTHPGTKSRIDYYVGMFKNWGFDYIKLDFLTHGSLESAVRSDPTVKTGMQAFNQGMQYVDKSIGGTMFISESIAPLFPYQYAHARRVSCDTYGAAVGFASAEYELNSASYGFWMSGRLYRYNDPDEMVFEGYSASDNMTRLLSAVVSGTVFLDGDDLSEVDGQALARTYLTNARINSVAALGQPFRPIEGNTGTSAASAFVLANGGLTYLALFNFTPSAETETIDLTRAGLSAAQAYTVTDLWTGETSTAVRTLTVDVASEDGKLLELQ